MQEEYLYMPQSVPDSVVPGTNIYATYTGYEYYDYDDNFIGYIDLYNFEIRDYIYLIGYADFSGNQGYIIHDFIIENVTVY
jgi:hypothetical protein